MIKYLIGFKKNVPKGNADKCHLITNSKTPVRIEVSNITIINKEQVKLLGIYLDNRLNFDYHISQLCKETGKKNACSYSSFQIHEHFTTQTNCKCFYNVSFLILFFHLNISHSSYEHKVNRIHEKTLGLIYPNQHQLTFKELLEESKTVSIHQRNLQILATDIYKAKNKVSPEVVNSLFEFSNKN